MNRKTSLSLVAASLSFLGGTGAWAQSYSNTVMALSPAAYWPLSETAQPPTAGLYVATNIGTLGAVGNGYYETWWYTNTASARAYVETNDIVHVAGATGDGDTAMKDGTAGQYVVIPRSTNGVANSAVTIQAPFSIELWAYPTSTTSALYPLVTEGRNNIVEGSGTSFSTVLAGFSLGQYGANFYFNVSNTNGQNRPEVDASFTANAWYHIVAVFDGTTEYIYKNGNLVSHALVTPNAAGLYYVPDMVSPLMIGAGTDLAASDGGNAFPGNIDEVAIYNVALNAGQIANHYGAQSNNYSGTVLGDNPIIYLRLDEPAFTPATLAACPMATNYGTIGANANGIYMPGTVPGIAGPPYKGFGSTSRAVAIPFNAGVDVGNGNIPALLNPTGKTAFSVAGWFQANPSDCDARFQQVISHSDSSWRLSLDTVGANHFNPGNGIELQAANVVDASTNNMLVNDGLWHFVAGVTDGTNESLYVDGTLVKSGSPMGSIGGSAADVMLGGDPVWTAPNGSVPGGRYFDGNIAQMAFFTNALTAAQIQQIYSAGGVPPFFRSQPVAGVLNAGQSFTNTVAVGGATPYSYQWYLNNSPVSGQTNASLVYSPATAGESGNYYVVATNAYGATTSSVVQLTVYGPPTVQQQPPTAMTVFAGTSPTLWVEAAGATPMYYYWKSNSSVVASGTNSTYTITNIHTGATYSCTLSNMVTTASMNPIAITVVAAPTAPYPVQVLADKPMAYYRLDEGPDNNNGDDGVIAWDYAGGNNAVYTNVVLGLPGYNTESFGSSGASDPTETSVLFGEASQNNSFAGGVPAFVNFGTPSGGNAEFSVEAWVSETLYQTLTGDAIVALGTGNGGEQFVLDTGAGTSGTLRFFVRNAAGNVSGASSTNLILNDNKWHHVVGVCDEANGNVLLYMDGALLTSGTITPGSGLLASTTPMSIGARQSESVTPATYDAQFYGFIDDVAVYGKALSATQVQAHYFAAGVPPVITQVSPASQFNANAGTTVTMSVVAQGTTPFTYQWYDPNSNPIPWGTGATLNLTNILASQAGNYTVVVNNLYSPPSATASIYLTVGSGPPQITADLQPTNVTCYAGTSNSFSVAVSGSAPFFYQWYLDGGKINGAANPSYSFAALGGTNTYYCAISNNAGGPIYSSTATVVGVVAPTLNTNDYSSSVKITFSGYNRTDALVNFPVLVELGTNMSGFSYQQFASPEGGDLRFTDSTGTRELPYEINQWNPNGTSTVWVQVPSLYSNAVIWAYWGNPEAITPMAWSTNGGVWLPNFADSPNFDLVWHLEESGTNFADSTLLNPGVSTNPPTLTGGIVGQGCLFDGASTYVSAGVVNPGQEFTLYAWVNLAAAESNIQGIWAGDGGSDTAGFRFYVNSWNTTDGKVVLETGDGGADKTIATGGGLVTPGGWHMLTAVIDEGGTNALIYVDGALEASGTILGDFVNTNTLHLGDFNGGFWYLNGAMDEARISTTTNSASWIWATYATMAQNATFSTNSGVSTTDVDLSYQVINGELVLTWPQGTLQAAGQVIGSYTNVPGATSPHTNAMTAPQLFYRVKVR
jgi:hypothetical protein